VSINRSLISGVLFCGAVFVSGCGSGSTVTQGGGGGSTTFQGQVVSGSAGVTGAAIQIYTAGNAGNGSAATPMLTRTVTTDGTGMFSIAGDYTCGQSSTGATISGSNQVYIVATGGATGANTSNNGALVMLAALGTCSNLGGASNIDIDEVTTAAAAWALAPFASSATNIGASSTNATGIENAFLDAALLANPTTGVAATLATNLTVETGKLNGLADALASCVNANDTIACGPLFTAATPSGGAMPMDTFTTALNIVKHPGQNVAAVYAVIPNSPPYATTLTEAPNDWTMSLTVTGGGLSQPTALGVDSQDNVWVANFYGPLSAFGPQGAPLSSTGFGLINGAAAVIDEAQGLAIDTSDNIWVTNTNGGGGNGSVTKFLGATSGSVGSVPQPAGYSDGSIQFPYAVAADTNGNIFIANSGNSSATVYNDSGTLVSPGLGASLSLNDSPNAIALDADHGFWLSGDDTVAHISSSGTLLSNPICCQQSLGMATDATGDLWVADYGNGATPHGAIAEVVTDNSGNASVPIYISNVGGIDHPQAIAVDAAQNVWVANWIGESITEVAGNAGTLAPGTAISPTTGVYGVGGYGLDASILGPLSVQPDRSGNLWVTNESGGTVTMFFGLAAPTVTPLQPVPMAP
jgi:hypothetical protein